MSLISDWFWFCVRSHRQSQEPQTRPPAASRPPPRKRRNRTRRTTKTALSAPIEGKRIESRRFCFLNVAGRHCRWAPLRVSASVSPMLTICIILLLYHAASRCGANYSFCLRHRCRRESDYALAELWKPSACSFFFAVRLASRMHSLARRLEWKYKKEVHHSRCITRICYFYARSVRDAKINLLLQRAGQSRCWNQCAPAFCNANWFLLSVSANVCETLTHVCVCCEIIECLICFE